MGFPAPTRTPGGQRRYSHQDVDRVLAALDERQRGLGLPAAVRSARRAGHVGAQSLHAQLRSEHPHLDPMRIDRRVMAALSFSIEDECLAHASQPVLFGGFQSQRHFLPASTRWRELARGATGAFVMSDFESSDPDASPARVALAADSPMLNEWCLVCMDPGLSVVLAGWETPRLGRSDSRRRFEALFSMEPAVVRGAALLCATTCELGGLTGLATLVNSHLDGLVENPRRAESLMRRFATYSCGDDRTGVRSGDRGNQTR
jgi:MerR family transcriptional regulator, light-induced transcriptional regulator